VRGEFGATRRPQDGDREPTADEILLVTIFLSMVSTATSLPRPLRVADEDRRQVHRELATLTWERTRLVNRIKGLLALHGVVLARRGLPRHLPAELRGWKGEPLPAEAQARFAREWRRLVFVRREVLTLVRERRDRLRRGDPTDPTLPIVRRLIGLRAIGEVSAWVYATEFFAWRQFRNRRQVGAAAGLCSTLRSSGDITREQGISKAGNRYLRALAIELAWNWLRRQPQSALSQWYQRRYATGGARLRRIGIVALARKLLIALWRYLEADHCPRVRCSKPDRARPLSRSCWCVVPVAAAGLSD
jgi:transposase